MQTLPPFHVGGTIYFVFQTKKPSDGVTPIAPNSTPTVTVYKNESATGESATVAALSGVTGGYSVSFDPAGEAERDNYILKVEAAITDSDYNGGSSFTHPEWFHTRCFAIERGTDSAALASGVTVTAIGNNVITAASIAADAAAEIGTATLSALGTGSWATAIPWNTAWNADVQSECADAITAADLMLASSYTAPDNASITAIKAKTDNLPSDPADQSAVEAAITSAVSTIRGADNDTLKTLSDQIDGLSASTGSGARTVTITVNDGTTVLQNARIRLTEGVNTYTGTTDVSGVVVFNVDDATYTVGITKSGYTYAGTSLVVDGTETRTYSMTAVSVTPPDDPALCAVTMHVYDQYGADMASQPVEITFVKWETTATDTPPVLSPPPVLSTNAEGIVSTELFREATYKIVYGNAPYTRRVDVTIPDAATYTVEL